MAVSEPHAGLRPANYLICPSCRSPELRTEGERIVCSGCGQSYMTLLGIVDFRQPEQDETVGIPISEDLLLAQLLAYALPRVATYNQLHSIYEQLYPRASEAPTTGDVDRLVAQSKPRPLAPDQIIHGPAILAKIEQYLADSGRSMPQRRIALEDGAGIGLFIDGFSAAFDRVVTVDFSMAFLVLALKIIEERGLDNVTLICANAERLPIASGTMDFIHSNNVIEHVTNKAAMVGEARRVLADKGLLFLLSPNYYSLYFEPHYRLPGYGFIPRPVRNAIVRHYIGRATVDDVSLIGLRRLKRLLAAEFGSGFRVSFIPRHLGDTVTGGKIRGTIVRMLNSRVAGRFANLVVNRLLLGVMPYHAAICFKQPSR